MKNSSKPPARHPRTRSSSVERTAARHEQILQAAEQCFCQYGFHKTSIARISKAAAMSAGHIYHYFANKEAIIAAIVHRDLQKTLSLSAQLNTAPDVFAATVSRASSEVEAPVDARLAALKLEIIAEGARNPAIAKIIQDANQQRRQSFIEILGKIRREQGHQDDDATLNQLSEMIGALFEGLLIRSVSSPDMDRHRIATFINCFFNEFVSKSALGKTATAPKSAAD